jgi:acyl-CoA thioesterase
MNAPWNDLILQPGDTAMSFRGVISDSWRIAALPIGGFPVAIAIEAMAAVLARSSGERSESEGSGLLLAGSSSARSESAGSGLATTADNTQRLRTITAMFAGPVAAGPIEIDVTVLRRGRSVTQLMATVRNPDKDSGLTAIAAFGADRPGFTFTDTEIPLVPPVEACRSWEEAKPEDFVSTWPPAPYWTEVCESRLAIGRWDHEPFVAGVAEEAMWFRFSNPPITHDGMLHRAVIAVLSDSMPGAVGSKVDEQNWFAPSVDLTIHYMGPLTPGWVLSHSRCVWAGDGYASASVELWDPRTKTLAARATQVMLFTFGH